MNKIFSRQFYYFFIRIFAGIAAFILISSILNNFFIYSPDEQNMERFSIHRIFLFIENSVALIPCILILINPNFDFLISFVAFIYSVGLAFFEPENVMSLYMYGVGVSVLIGTKRFQKHKILKIILLAVFFIAESLFAIRFGAMVFISAMQLRMGHGFVLFLIVYFLAFAFFGEKKAIFEGKEFFDKNSVTLNLADFPELRQSDVDLLQYIQQGKTYLEIADVLHSSEGYMKNQFSKIYKIIKVSNKSDFLRKYGDVQIIYDFSDKK